MKTANRAKVRLFAGVGLVGGGEGEEEFLEFDGAIVETGVGGERIGIAPADKEEAAGTEEDAVDGDCDGDGFGGGAFDPGLTDTHGAAPGEGIDDGVGEDAVTAGGAGAAAAEAGFGMDAAEGFADAESEQDIGMREADSGQEGAVAIEDLALLIEEEDGVWGGLHELGEMGPVLDGAVPVAQSAVRHAIGGEEVGFKN